MQKNKYPSQCTRVVSKIFETRISLILQSAPGNMSTSTVLPRVTCFDVQTALDSSPVGTTACIDLSTLVGRLNLSVGNSECSCDVFKYPVPTLEPSFDCSEARSHPVLNVVVHRLRDFSSGLTREGASYTFREVKHVDNFTIKALLEEGPERVQFEADCTEGTFTVRVLQPVETTVSRAEARKIYEATRRFLRGKRKRLETCNRRSIL